jgi:hypothetical protein
MLSLQRAVLTPFALILLPVIATFGCAPRANIAQDLATGGVGAGGSTSSATGGSTSTTTTTTPAGTGGFKGNPNACPGLPISTVGVDAGTVDADAGAQCAGRSLEIEPWPLDMFIMMDRTQSMTYPIQNTSLVRWDVLQQGVNAFINDPLVTSKKTRVGLGFFGATGNPNDRSECEAMTYAKPLIEIEDITTSGPKILQAVTDERALLGGQTPWFPALQGALMHAQDWQLANPTRITVAVLVTDGYPTECDTNMSDITAMVGEYYAGVQGTYNTRGSPGIRTYIIGVAVDKFNLDDVARAGGTGFSTIVDSPDAVSKFANAMANITKADIPCTIALPAPPDGSILDPGKVQVVYKPYQGDNQEIPAANSSTGCAGANGGWYYDNPIYPTTVTLCPCSCANLGAGQIEFRFGCRPKTQIN